MGAAKIRRDFKGGDGSDSGGISALSLASLTIGGSMLGGADGTAFVNVSGNLGPVKISGELRGGNGADSAHIFTFGNLASLTIGRSLVGVGTNSALVRANGDIGAVKITLNLQGGSGDTSGQIISTAGKIAGVTIRGDLIGGGAGAGAISAHGDMGAVKISGDLRGGAGEGSGRIGSAASIVGVTIGGSLRGDTPGSATISAPNNLGAVKIAGDIQGGDGDGSAEISYGGSLVSLTVGGSLIGGMGNSSGSVQGGGIAGAVKIAGDIAGGGGDQAGGIYQIGAMASLSVGRAVTGGAGASSGGVSVSAINGTVTIRGNLQGGSGDYSGRIESDGALAGITLNGSLLGGTGDDSGFFYSSANMGPVSIKGSLIGGNSGADDLLRSGGILSGGRIASVTIGGSIVAGIPGGIGRVFQSARISADNDIGSLTVKGNIIGTAQASITISARGQAVQTATDLAFGSIKVGGRIEFARILAGYAVNLSAVNANAQIGTVTVGGDWIASSIVAGAMNPQEKFGDGNDVIIASILPSGIVPTITSISIGGAILGTPDVVDAADHYGFVAAKVGVLKVGGATVALNPSSSDDFMALGPTLDFTLVEVAW
jgi:hypothetical protein